MVQKTPCILQVHLHHVARGRYRSMSSAYGLDPTNRLRSLISLTYSKNNKGRRTEPYGTPDMTGRAVDISLFRTTDCHLSVR